MQQPFPLTDSPPRTLSHKLSYSQQNFTIKESKSNNSGLKKRNLLLEHRHHWQLARIPRRKKKKRKKEAQAR